MKSKFLRITTIVAALLLMSPLAFGEWDSPGKWDSAQAGNGNLTSDLIPAVDNTYDVGSSTKRWAEGHFMDLDVYDVLTIAGVMQHLGDTDTYFQFADDQINLYAGNIQVVKFDENGASSVIVFNETGEDFDLRVESDNQPHLLYMDAANDKLGVVKGTWVAGSYGGLFNVVSAGSGTLHTYIDQYDVTETQAGNLNFRHSNTDTMGTLTETVDTCILGQIGFWGVDDGGNWDNGARIFATQDGSASAGVPTNINLETRTSAGAFNNNQFVLHNDGEVYIGANVSYSAVSNAYSVEINTKNNATGGLALTCWEDGNTSTNYLTFQKSGSDTPGTYTAVADNERLGYMYAYGADGTNFEAAAAIKFEVDGTPGANDMPGRIILATTADGANSPTERMRITQAGFVYLGTTQNGTARFNIETTGSANAQFIAGTNQSAALILQNDAQSWNVNVQTTDAFVVYDVTGSKTPFYIGVGVADNALKLTSTTGGTGGAGSAGAGNQYVELELGGSRYKILHDGTL